MGIEKGQILVCDNCKDTHDFPIEIFLKQEYHKVYSLYDSGWMIDAIQDKTFCKSCSHLIWPKVRNRSVINRFIDPSLS